MASASHALLAGRGGSQPSLDPIEDFALGADGSLYIGRGRWHFRPLLIDDVSSR